MTILVLRFWLKARYSEYIGFISYLIAELANHWLPAQTGRSQMNYISVSLAFLLVVGCTSPNQIAISEEIVCGPIKNTQQFIDLAQTHILAFGELHGTNESLAIVKKVVCSIASEHAPLLVGIEADEQYSRDLNEALEPPFDANKVLAAAPGMWTVQDGRSSTAMLEFLRAISSWRAQGADITVFSFDHASEDWSSPGLAFNSRDQGMAANIDLVVRGNSDAVVVLTGGSHARKVGFEVSDEAYSPMATLIKSRPVFSMEMAHLGGKAWLYTDSQDTHTPQTGPRDIPASSEYCSNEQVFEYRIIDNGAYDGLYCVGKISPSLPPA